MKKSYMYFIADNGNIYSSGVLAKRLKNNPETIIEVVRAESWLAAKKKRRFTGALRSGDNRLMSDSESNSKGFLGL